MARFLSSLQQPNTDERHHKCIESATHTCARKEREREREREREYQCATI
jgi:hypothetical protein